jgi:PAS domain S-box-containing protein/prepilin-type N-terminal cleavage/methylation domain-containing protein
MSRNGFSLIELVIVTMIIGILGAVAAPRFADALSAYRVETAARQLRADLENDLALLRDFADQAAIAVRNARQMEQLREEKARVEAVIANSPNGVMILDPDLHIVIINRAFSDLVGVTVDEAKGKPCYEVMALENPTGDHLCQEGRHPPPPTGIWQGEGDIIRPGYKRITVGVTYFPLFDRNGNLINVIATLTDITRYREAEELKSTFVSVISHELKTPVSLIKGYASTLARDDASWDDRKAERSSVLPGCQPSATTTVRDIPDTGQWR